MLKQANLSFSVTAQANGNDMNSIQFSTQDKNTAKLIFTIKDGKTPLNLTDVEGEITLVMQDKSRFTGDVEVTEPINGVLEYTITPEQIRHAGRVQGEVTLKANDGSSVGGFRFNFSIKKALMDEDLGPAKEFYIHDLEAVKQEVQEKAEVINSEVATVKKEAQTRLEEVNTKATEVTRNLEQLDEEYQNKVYTVDEKLADVQATVNDLRENGTGIDAQARQEVEQVTAQLADITAKLEFNVKDFGAKGDDFTDDTIAIQNALDAVAVNGGILRIPTGVYRISRLHEWLNYNGYTQLVSPAHSCLILKGNNVTIKGDGIGKTILKMYPSRYRDTGTLEGSLTTMIAFQCAIDEPRTNQENIAIEGVELNGGRGLWNQAVLDKNALGPSGNFDNTAGDGSHSGKGINARTAFGNLTNFKLINCKIANTYAEGVYSNNAKDSYVEGCAFDYCRPAGGNLSGSVIYKNCVFSKSYTFSVEHMNGKEKNYLKVIDCDFHDLDNLSQYHIVANYNTPAISGSVFEVTGCTFYYDDPSVTGRLVGSLKETGYETVTIKGNKMLQKVSEAKGVYQIDINDSKIINIEDNFIVQEGAPPYSFSNSAQNNAIYTIRNNIRKVVGNNSKKQFKNTINKNVLGNMPVFRYENNLLISDVNTGGKQTTANSKTTLIPTIDCAAVGKIRVSISSDADTTINRLYYGSPTGYGGDGIENDIISSPLSVKSGHMLTFEIDQTLKLNDRPVPPGGYQFGIITTDAVNINYSVMF